MHMYTYTDVDLPAVTITPLTQSVEVTHTAKFTAAITGVGSFIYQWQNGRGRILTGETGPTLIIHNAMRKHQSNYTCIVTNNCGDIVVSNTVTLQVTSTYLHIS